MSRCDCDVSIASPPPPPGIWNSSRWIWEIRPKWALRHVSSNEIFYLQLQGKLTFKELYVGMIHFSVGFSSYVVSSTVNTFPVVSCRNNTRNPSWEPEMLILINILAEHIMALLIQTSIDTPDEDIRLILIRQWKTSWRYC